ncbi:MAG: molybdopterin molybdotransferase MoeA [Candidatus Caldarchaeum sp.]
MYRRIEKFTDVWDGQRVLLSHVNAIQEIENVRVFEAVDRVLAYPAYSPKDLPPHHASHMDGFAVNSKDLEQASAERPVRLHVVGEITPGKRHALVLHRGETARILTGGFLPEGADAVVPQEFVRIEDDVVVFMHPAEPWQYVDVQGFDIKAGQLLFPTGHRLKAADTALLASLGFSTVDVIRRPRAGIMAVGDELTDKFEELEKGKVLNTHTWVVRRLVQASGAEAFFLGILPDNPSIFEKTISSNIGHVDLLITIAGSSISEKDVSSIYAENSGEGVYIHGLALQPGRVGGFAVVAGKPLIMLPGLIMSTLNVFMFLAYPVLRKLQHQQPSFYHHRVRALLTETVRFRKYHNFVKVVWVSVEEGDDMLLCRPNLGESSGMSIPSRSDGFIIGMPGVKEISEGSEVWVHYPPTL